MVIRPIMLEPVGVVEVVEAQIIMGVAAVVLNLLAVLAAADTAAAVVVAVVVRIVVIRVVVAAVGEPQVSAAAAAVLVQTDQVTLEETELTLALMLLDTNRVLVLRLVPAL